MTLVSAQPALYQVLVRQPGRETISVPLAAFPFVIGRSRDASLLLDAPGVWPRHLDLTLLPDEGLVIQVEKGSIATLEDRPFERHRVRHGDEVRLGAVRLQFLVSPPVRRSLSGWEMVLWGLLAAMVLVQIFVVVALPHD